MMADYFFLAAVFLAAVFLAGAAFLAGAFFFAISVTSFSRAWLLWVAAVAEDAIKRPDLRAL